MDGGEPIDPNAYGPPDPYPPPGSYPQPGPYGAPSPYGTYGQPAAYPLDRYGHPQPGVPPQGWYGYPYLRPAHPGSGRPGLATAASVLAYVLGGLLILAGVLLLFSASFVSDLGDTFGEDTGSATTELVLDGLVNFLAAGLLIAGGVKLTSGQRDGRVLMAWGAAVTGAASIYWMIRSSADALVMFYVFLFDALAVVAICLMGAAAVTRWLRTQLDRR